MARTSVQPPNRTARRDRYPRLLSMQPNQQYLKLNLLPVVADQTSNNENVARIVTQRREPRMQAIGRGLIFETHSARSRATTPLW